MSDPTQLIDETVTRLRDEDSDFLTPETLVTYTGCTLEEAKERLALAFTHIQDGGHEGRSQALCGAEHQHGVSTTVAAANATCPECLAKVEATNA